MRGILVAMALTLWSVPAMAAPTAPSTAVPAMDAAFKADLQRLMQLSGAAINGKQVLDQMMVALRPMAPGLPDRFWTEFAAEVDIDGLTEMVLPIWAKYYTREDVKQLIVFYESPLGRKLVSVQPQIMAESMAAGATWGEALGAKIDAKLRAEVGQ
jgi:hypothetical protein